LPALLYFLLNHNLQNNYTGYSIAVNPQYIKWGEQYSWATVNTLCLYNSAICYWNKSSLSFDVAIPVAGFSSRPVAGKAYKETVSGTLYNSFGNVNVNSLHNLKAATVSIQYQKRISREWLIKAGASFSYKELKAGYEFREQTYQLGAGVSYRIL
jgi:hypothetical protein